MIEEWKWDQTETGADRQVQDATERVPSPERSKVSPGLAVQDVDVEGGEQVQGGGMERKEKGGPSLAHSLAADAPLGRGGGRKAEVLCESLHAQHTRDWVRQRSLLGLPSRLRWNYCAPHSANFLPPGERRRERVEGVSVCDSHPPVPSEQRRAGRKPPPPPALIK